MTRPLAIFDIDGTLVDSRASIHRAACEAARDIGLPEPEYDRVRQIVGLSLEHAMAVLEPGLDAETLARFVAGFRASFNRMYAEGHEEPLYPEAMTTLRPPAPGRQAAGSGHRPEPPRRGPQPGPGGLGRPVPLVALRGGRARQARPGHAACRHGRLRQRSVPDRDDRRHGA